MGRYGNYEALPEQGIRLWRDILSFLPARSAELTRDQFDLLSPEREPVEAARYIRDVRVTTISSGTVTAMRRPEAHRRSDVDFLNRKVTSFLYAGTEHGQRIKRACSANQAAGWPPGSKKRPRTAIAAASLLATAHPASA